MGLGMLGALGGLGDAGMQIGGQMMQSALRQDDRRDYMDLLQQERERVEKVQERKRMEIANTINSVQGETEKDRAIAAANALQSQGRLAEGDHFYRRAKDIERSEYEKERLKSAEDRDNKRYEYQTKRDEERYALQNAREERMTKAQEQSMRIQAASAARAAEDQRFQRKDRDNKEKATGMLAGYKISKERGLDDAANVYLENALGLGVDPRMIDKNDPLSSQVSAAKAVLADIEASDEQKAAARQVLTLANSSYIDRRAGVSKQDAAPKAPAAPKLFNGERNEELAARLKAIAQQKQ